WDGGLTTHRSRCQPPGWNGRKCLLTLALLSLSFRAVPAVPEPFHQPLERFFLAPHRFHSRIGPFRYLLHGLGTPLGQHVLTTLFGNELLFLETSNCAVDF